MRRLIGVFMVAMMAFGMMGMPASASYTIEAGGGESFTVPSGATFSDLIVMSATLSGFEDGACQLGSPRFAVGLDTDGDGATNGYAFAYLADYPNYQSCGDADATDGQNLIGIGDARWDLSQVGGIFYDTYSNAMAFLADATVTEVFFVNEYAAVTVDSLVVQFAGPHSKDSCKNGGYAVFGFSNQGDCIQFVNTGKDKR